MRAMTATAGVALCLALPMPVLSERGAALAVPGPAGRLERRARRFDECPRAFGQASLPTRYYVFVSRLLELLEYLPPRDGRPFPPDTRAPDLVRWHSLLLTPDAGAAAARLGASTRATDLPIVVSMSGATLGFRQGFTVRDPDGHALQLRAK